MMVLFYIGFIGLPLAIAVSLVGRILRGKQRR